MGVSQFLEKLGGRFLVFDGPDGAGKSTQRAMLAAKLDAAGIPTVSCRDPGGTTIGDRIRSVLLDHDLSEMDVTCETLLFMASRAQLLAEIILPAKSAGKAILCDRFVSSTCAYQGAAGFDPKRTIELAHFAIGSNWPDLTVILDVDAEAGLQRVGRKPHLAGKNRKKSRGEGTLFDGSVTDAMEARPVDFHRKVRRLFLELPKYFPSRVEIIDGRGNAEEVHERIMECLGRVFG